MAFDLGQTSPFPPASCSHKGKTHMVFVANNSSNELLHADARDGRNFIRRNNLGQSTKFAPAITSNGITLRVIFVANNNANEILQCVYDDVHDTWGPNTLIGEQTHAAPTLGRTPTNGLQLYFVANNNTNTLLMRPLAEN